MSHGNRGMNQAQRLDLSTYADASPTVSLRLLFLHHSCGGQLLAAPGPDAGTDCIYATHPNGGGLRAGLEGEGYEVHEASYRSKLGARTDLFDWLPKFRGQMDAVLTCDHQDKSYPDAGRNEIVVFKSCFPNNEFVSAGMPPGNPEGPELTVWNAKAAYLALLPEFGKHPEVLFVSMTAPPVAAGNPTQPVWKRFARRVLDRGPSRQQSGALAREFNRWLSRADGWLGESQPLNVVVFDYYDILTDGGASDSSRYPTGAGDDSHPSREGNERAAAAFVPFLNRAVRRAGLVSGATTFREEPILAVRTQAARPL